MYEEKGKHHVKIAAIFGITALDGIALLTGIDGTMFLASIVAIAGIAGFVMLKREQRD